MSQTPLLFFSSRACKCSPGLRLQIDFSEDDSKIPLKEFFIRIGLTGTPEVSYCDKVDRDSVFHETGFDVHGENKDNAEITAIFT